MVYTSTGSSAVNKYPSSSHYTRNWDKLVSDIKKEEKDEKPEGNEAMNKLLQQIYGDGSDEVKKAMNKSFVSFYIASYEEWQTNVCMLIWMFITTV